MKPETEIQEQQRRDDPSSSETPSAGEFDVPSLDDIVDNNRISTPTRILDQIVPDDSESQSAPGEFGTRTLSTEEEQQRERRNLVIARFYNGAVSPQAQGFQATA